MTYVGGAPADARAAARDATDLIGRVADLAVELAAAIAVFRCPRYLDDRDLAKLQAATAILSHASASARARRPRDHF